MALAGVTFAYRPRSTPSSLVRDVLQLQLTPIVAKFRENQVTTYKNNG